MKSFINNSVQKIVQSKVFTYCSTIEGKVVCGNPASIVFCKNTFPTIEQMQLIAVQEKQPMTAFVLQQNNHIFFIKYFTPFGTEFGLCAHASLIASYFIFKEFGFNKVVLQAKMLNLNLELTNNFIAENNCYNIQIKLPAYKPHFVSPHLSSSYLACLNIDNSLVNAVYKCNELNDEIIVLKNSHTLRNINPNFETLKKILASANTRGLLLTSTSEIKNIDYEVRIFAPHFGINEDVSCGSANCSLLPLWSCMLHTTIHKEFNIICPYNGKENSIGGFEFGKYDINNNYVYIGGLINN